MRIIKNYINQQRLQSQNQNQTNQNHTQTQTKSQNQNQSQNHQTNQTHTQTQTHIQNQNQTQIQTQTQIPTQPPVQAQSTSPSVKKEYSSIRRVNRGRKEKEGYNSEDEEIKPKLSTIFDENMEFVAPEELARRLSQSGLQIAEMAKDGNCLFHSVADQVYGDPDMHDVVRRACVDYMEKERDHYSQFVTEDFSEYLKRKRCAHCYGNHLELQAISELYNRPIMIYTVDANPLNIFQGTYATDNAPLRLSYHYGNHYNSVRDPNNPTFGVGLGLPGLDPGAADRDIVERAQKESENLALTDQMVEETLRESEMELIEDNLLEESFRESELEMIQAALERSAFEHSLHEF